MKYSLGGVPGTEFLARAAIGAVTLALVELRSGDQRRCYLHQACRRSGDRGGEGEFGYEVEGTRTHARPVSQTIK